MQASKGFISALRDRGVLIATGISVVVIILTLVILARLSGGTTTTSPAEQTALDFYKAVAGQNYNGAYGYFHRDQQGKITQYTFTLFAKQEDANYGTVKNYQVVRADDDKNVAGQINVQMRITRSGGTSYVITLQIQQDSGVWKIRGEDRAI